MKTRSQRLIVFLLLLVLAGFPAVLSGADLLDDMLKKGLPQVPGLGGSSLEQTLGGGLDERTIASGLKEALSVGTKNAVGLVSKLNGYFGNEAIRILLPDKLQMAADLLGKVGYQRQVDEFIRNMNRAAENAAPMAVSHFAEAIKGMTIDDARKILAGGNTAATDYFKSRSMAKLYDAFKPAISTSMNRIGVVRSYNAMLSKVPDVPFAKPDALDLDHYITNKALDGLFYMVAQEEQKIRTNPVARTTALLTKVFGR